MELEDRPIGWLRARVYLASALIRMLREDGDERALAAAGVLEEQQRELNTVLVRKIRERRAARGEAEPAPVVIGLRPVVLMARALRR